jgi:hypothetical protein
VRSQEKAESRKRKAESGRKEVAAAGGFRRIKGKRKKHRERKDSSFRFRLSAFRFGTIAAL